MLSAKEARDIARASHANVEKILEKLDVQIRAAAEAGQPSIMCEHEDTYICVKEGDKDPTPTPLMVRLSERLKNLGYSVSLIPSAPYVSMGDLDDTPMTVKYRLNIRW